jgi:hypothetical protein
VGIPKLPSEKPSSNNRCSVEFSFQEIAPYVQQYKDEHEKCHSRKIKICLIDSGVIVVENKAVELGKPKSHIASQIVDGKSFVYEGSLVSPWWHASVPHGTQMASLICAIDPCCQLFVAKVGDITTPNLDLTTAHVTPERVAEVSWRELPIRNLLTY